MGVLKLPKKKKEKKLEEMVDWTQAWRRRHRNIARAPGDGRELGGSVWGWETHDVLMTTVMMTTVTMMVVTAAVLTMMTIGNISRALIMPQGLSKTLCTSHCLFFTINLHKSDYSGPHLWMSKLRQGVGMRCG